MDTSAMLAVLDADDQNHRPSTSCALSDLRGLRDPAGLYHRLRRQGWIGTLSTLVTQYSAPGAGGA